MPSLVFARDASGLVREFGILDSILIASAMVFALLFTTTNLPWFYGYTDGANLTLSLLIAAVPFMFLMITYWAISVAMPRTGSDYVWVSRIFSPSIGFVWSVVYVFVVFFTAYVGGSLTEFSVPVSTTLSTYGIVAHSPSFSNLGNYLGGTTGTFELAVIFTCIFGAVAIFGRKYVKAIIYISSIVAIIGIALMWYLLNTSNPVSFANHWNAMLVNNTSSMLNSSASYSSLYQLALKSGATDPMPGLSPALAAVPLSALFLFGGNYISGFSGEIRNVKRVIPLALFLSLILGILYWTITSTLTLNAVGSNWLTAIGYNWDKNGVPGYGLPYPPTQPLMLAAIAYPNAGLVFLMFSTYLVGSIASLFVYFWIPTKYIFAWSFDRVIPASLSDISGRFTTPYKSILVIIGIGIMLSYIYSFAGWSTSFTIGSVAWGVAYIIPSLALMVFPIMLRRGKNEKGDEDSTKKGPFLEKPPEFIFWNLAGIPLLSVIGFVTAAMFSYIGYIGYTSPAVTNTAYAWFGVELLLAVIVFGYVVYYASKAYYKRKKIDISLAFKAIPPE